MNAFAKAARRVAGAVVSNWSGGWRDAAASAVAAGLSWTVSREALGHPLPVFAPIAAIIILAPGLPSHGRQAAQMMTGMLAGIAVGEWLLEAPIPDQAAKIAIVSFVAIMAAITFGLAPVIAIQGGVSTVLVLAMGPDIAGATRIADAMVGTMLGLLFSQVLLTEDPVRLIDRSAKRLLRVLERGFSEAATSIEDRDGPKGRAVVRHFFAGRDSLAALGADIASARSSATWTLRGRMAARDVYEAVARYEGCAVRVYASTLLFSDALAEGLRSMDEPPMTLSSRVRRLAAIAGDLADGSTTVHPREPSGSGPLASSDDWRTCIDHLTALERALGALGHASSGKRGASSLVRR